MEVHGDPRARASGASPARDCARVGVSKELLTAGSGGGGIWDKLLINPKPNPGKNSTLQTVRVERSPLLAQVQTFLPRMAAANEKLRRDMAAAPPDHFNIEKVDETPGEVIQMDVALFEMSPSECREEDSSEENSLDSSEEEEEEEEEGEDALSPEVTVDNIKLPQSHSGKGKIEVLDSPAAQVTK